MNMRSTSLVTTLAVLGTLLTPALSWAGDKPLTIMLSSPDLAFPFSVHIMKEMQDEAAKLGNINVVVSDGQRNSSKQSADIEAAIAKGVDGIVISPNDSAALAPAIQEAIDAKIPVVTVDRSIDSVKGIFAHVGADNVKGGEVQGQLIIKLFPGGARVMNLQGQPGTSAAIDRNKGLHNALDPLAAKYKFVFEDTAGFDRAKGLSMTESALASMATPPDAIAAANDDMALGALEALKARDLTDKVKLIGFDALPESLGKVRDGAMTGTIEQMPGKQGRQAVDILVAFVRDGKAPEKKITLLTPIAVTKDNLDAGERLGELK
ncbi:MAG: sugar ABC transporter substrate-binding protein [Mesorhizobium sp.]|nr:MAG: sugar ABC transporter substrate-binding protein [Mesorhizobium sp.]TIV56111.1 MAG: sugar ABC transporter substrate-binding protein [Mesorhizobium sp.]